MKPQLPTILIQFKGMPYLGVASVADPGEPQGAMPQKKTVDKTCFTHLVYQLKMYYMMNVLTKTA